MQNPISGIKKGRANKPGLCSKQYFRSANYFGKKWRSIRKTTVRVRVNFFVSARRIREAAARLLRWGRFEELCDMT
ncbi:MAG: hypothetical protein WAK60_07880, partial [Sedimentisphaerales bacterium]